MASKYTDAKIIEALRQSRGLVYVAARKLGCSPQTIYARAKNTPVVAEVIEEERGLLIDTAEGALMKAINRGEAWAVCFTLKTIGQARGYRETTRTEVTGADGGAIEVRAVDYRQVAASVAPARDE